MEQHHDGHLDYSTLEVDGSANAPEVGPCPDLPEAKAEDHLPEALQDHGSQKQATICGLRPRNFWIALFGVVMVVAIAIGVGVGLGVREKNNSASTGGADDDVEPTVTPTAKPTVGRVASFSKLAAANYTSQQLVEYNTVYYQDNDLNIWMADLDTFTNEWTLLKVNTTGMDPKNGTAISASNWVSGDRTDLHLRFIASTTNNIRGIFSYQHQPKTSSWKSAGPPDDKWTATDASQLAHTGTSCADCDHSPIMAFRSATQNTTAFAYPYDTPAFNTSGDALPPGGVDVDADSAYAFAPMLSVDGEARPQTALYLSVGRRLQEFWFLFRVGWSARNLSVPMEIDPGAPIAATSYVYGGKRYVQVLVTRTDGGVRMAYLDGGTNSTADWAYTDEVSGMEDVVPLSPIAATQTGYVFAFEESGGSKEIVRFRRTSTTGMPVWERVGVVNTTVVD